MNWNNVRLIWMREVRDQLRDRRTMFMIFVLPLLLYPLLGTSLLQVAQFVQEKPTRVLVIGDFSIEGAPPLIENERFSRRLFEEPSDTNLLELKVEPDSTLDSARTPDDAHRQVLARAKRLLAEGRYQAVIYFPPDFAPRMTEFRQSLVRRAEGEAPDDAASRTMPQPEVFHTSAKETSRITQLRVREVLRAWTGELGRDNLRNVGVDPTAALPLRATYPDTADVRHRDAALWSKMMPFLLLIWALTGAFYPAVDLCAGEKERGTLETLLCSPAERRDIVWGKLLTIMCFSVLTVVLNVVSIGVTGVVALSGLPAVGPPPVSAAPWLLLALLPVSALFSALCLALATFARSSKEGQYYLMPLMLVALPLVVLPMAPGVELNLGNSLIPLTGLLLLLRQVIEGDGWRALPFVPPIVIVTLVCCVAAVRWAVDQFNSESVLFRESERLDLRLWLRHLVRDRQDLPVPAEAMFCGVLILAIKYFLSQFIAGQPGSFAHFVTSITVLQLVAIATPALLMAVMLTRRPLLSLRLRKTSWQNVAAGAALALALHPVANTLLQVVMKLYPLNPQVKAQLEQLIPTSAQFAWSEFALLIAVMAALPAVCEELAFRGFILSGFEGRERFWRGIFVSSAFFALTHSVLQQSLLAFPLGIVIAYLALRTGSLWPGVAFHFVHNALLVGAMQLRSIDLTAHPWLEWVFSLEGEEVHYNVALVGLSAFFAAWLLFALPDLTRGDRRPAWLRAGSGVEESAAAG